MEEKEKICKKVLLVEDERAIAKLFVIKLNKYIGEQDIVVYWANDLSGAEKLFKSYEDNLDAIVLDACVPGSEINTIPFLKFILESGFNGPVIVNSSIPEYNTSLMLAGATLTCFKNYTPYLIKKLLS
ncbi:response regulator [bacterium]|nr:response regulator [bacterium]